MHSRCSPVYINMPPSYIFQSLLFRPSRFQLPVEGADEGSPLTLGFNFFLDFFHFREFFLLSRTRVDGLAVLTRVGFNIQTIGTTQFLSFLNASRNEDCCCVWTGRGMLLLLPPPQASERASPSLSRHILGICQPPPNGNITVLPTTLVDSLIARGLCSAL